MTTILVTRWIAGRYRAVPWRDDTTEGEVEFPPSPWRLLRLLYQVWTQRVPSVDEHTAVRLLEKLAVPPVYGVPPFHLVPVDETIGARPAPAPRTSRTSRTMDASITLAPGSELAIIWPFVLDTAEHDALTRIADAVQYLGSAENLCAMRLDDQWRPGPEHAVRGPLDLAESVGSSGAAVPQLAAQLPLDRAALRDAGLAVGVAGHVQTRGTRFVAYPRSAPTPPPRSGPVTAVVFTILDAQRPPITSVVTVAERLRAAALKNLNELRGHVHAPSLLAGRQTGQDITTGHQHSHFLALPDPDRRIAELVVWTPGDLTDVEIQALGAVQALYGKQAPGSPPGGTRLRVTMARRGPASTLLTTLTGPSRVWHTVTPFGSERHQKKGRETFIEKEIRRELSLRGLPEPNLVTVGDDAIWRDFAHHRPRKAPTPRQAAPQGATVTLTFEQPIAGPLALGYLSHFGLGLFEPAV
jgi:CRISPR-associated protein Csb2